MKIEVTVHQHAGTFFGRMFGVFDANVTARAVAERLPGDDTLAIFSFENPMCGDENGLEFDAEERPHQRLHPQQRSLQDQPRAVLGRGWDDLAKQLCVEHRAGGVLAVRKRPASQSRAARRLRDQDLAALAHAGRLRLARRVYVLRRDDRDHAVRRDDRRRCEAARRNASERHVLRDDVVPPRRRGPERADHGVFRRRSRSKVATSS